MLYIVGSRNIVSLCDLVQGIYTLSGHGISHTQYKVIVVVVGIATKYVACTILHSHFEANTRATH